MIKSSKAQYCIKSCPSDDTIQLENLLNEMASKGWEIYTMHEVEGDNGFIYNCIFVRDTIEEDDDKEELDEILGFKTPMQKFITGLNDPFELCVETQRKIRDKRNRINKIKNLIDETSEDQRQKLNVEMSKCIEELDELKKQLSETISPDLMLEKIGQDKICIKLSEENLDLVNPDLEANLIAQTVKIRQKLTNKLGYIIPRIKFESDESLQSNEFEIDVRGVCAAKGCAYPDCLMYFKDDLNISANKDVIKDHDIVTGKTVYWLPEQKTKDFWATGLNASEMIARVLEYVCIKYVEDIFDYNDINKYIEIVSEENLYLIENIIPDFVSVAELKYILTSLIKEHVSIKDIVFIFDKINDFADEETKEDVLSKIRHALSRQISQNISDENNLIRAFELTPDTVKYFETKASSKKQVIKIDNTKVKSLADNIYNTVQNCDYDLNEIILIVPMEVRQLISIVLSQIIPNVKIIAKEEIAPEYNLEIIAKL